MQDSKKMTFYRKQIELHIYKDFRIGQTDLSLLWLFYKVQLFFIYVLDTFGSTILYQIYVVVTYVSLSYYFTAPSLLIQLSASNCSFLYRFLTVHGILDDLIQYISGLVLNLFHDMEVLIIVIGTIHVNSLFLISTLSCRYHKVLMNFILLSFSQ